jgi:hypothetical protein
MSINEVPAPPNPFPKRINSTILPAGTDLHRIYSTKYPGNAFNPSTEKLNRFSPIFQAGHVVAVLYAGNNRDTVIFETLFHHAPQAGAKQQRLPVSALQKKHYGIWRTQRDLKLAPLHAPDLRQFDLPIDQLTATDSKYYAQTARWAEAIHNTHPDIAGLQWTSYRGDPGVAYVLFENRVQAGDLVPVGVEVLMRHDAALYSAVVACGSRCGVRVTLPRIP